MGDERLINLVRQCPSLYNIHDPSYLDTNRKTQIWNQIALQCGVDVKKLRTRWGNIRENYRKSLSKRKTLSADPTRRCKRYKYANILEFLHPYLDEDLFSDGTKPPAEDEYIENNIWEIKEEPPEEYTLEAETMMPSSPVNSPPPASVSGHSSPVVHNIGRRSAAKKPSPRHSNAAKLMDFVLANNQSAAAQVKTADELFFQSLAMRIRDWPEEKKTKLQISILQCIQDVEKEV